MPKEDKLMLINYDMLYSKPKEKFIFIKIEILPKRLITLRYLLIKRTKILILIVF